MDSCSDAPTTRGRWLTHEAGAACPLAALLLAAVVLPASAGAPADVEAVGPLPECRLDDIMTVPRDYDSWSTTLVDWLLRVPRNTSRRTSCRSARPALPARPHPRRGDRRSAPRPGRRPGTGPR